MNTIHDGGNRTAFAHDLLCYKTNVDKAYQLYQQSGGFGPWYSSQSCLGLTAHRARRPRAQGRAGTPA